VREFPKQEKRVETGVVRFGDDWPGVFIRGDNAFGFAMSLKVIRARMVVDEAYGDILLHSVDQMIELLDKSNLKLGIPDEPKK